MKSPQFFVSTLRRAIAALFRIDDAVRQQQITYQETLDEIKVNQGLMLSELNRNKTSGDIRDYEFKVFSQWGEDGIIQRLIEIVPIANRTFIEFGVEDFSESNCRFLMMKDNWRGFVIDSDSIAMTRLKEKNLYWKYDLKAVTAFITRDNIDSLLLQSGFDSDVGILSLDIDGNDYYVLGAINSFKPRILICEYNAVFGTRKISIPYDPEFSRTRVHPSNLYFGASLGAMVSLAERKGYALVGVNRAGNNAFFVRRDLLTANLTVLSAEDAYSPSHFRESRNREGALTFLAAEDRLREIKGMPVINIDTGIQETL